MEPITAQINTIKVRGLPKVLDGYRRTNNALREMIAAGMKIQCMKSGLHRSMDSVIWFLYGEKPD